MKFRTIIIIGIIAVSLLHGCVWITTLEKQEPDELINTYAITDFDSVRHNVEYYDNGTYYTLHYRNSDLKRYIPLNPSLLTEWKTENNQTYYIFY